MVNFHLLRMDVFNSIQIEFKAALVNQRAFISMKMILLNKITDSFITPKPPARHTGQLHNMSLNP